MCSSPILSPVLFKEEEATCRENAVPLALFCVQRLDSVLCEGAAEDRGSPATLWRFTALISYDTIVAM